MKDLRVQRTYILLKDSLFKLLCKKTFEDIKVNDICNEAMIHRTTFYHHFQDKYELLEFCVKDTEQEVLEKMNRTYKTTQEFYTNLVMILLEYIGEKKEIFQNILKHNSENYITRLFMDTCVNYIYSMLKKEEDNRITHKADMSAMSHFYAGAVISTIVWWIQSNSSLNEEELCNMIISLIFDSPRS